MGSRYPHSSGERSELADRVVRVNRVAKVVKGGRKFSFSALIVVGDMNGRVGSGIGKAREVTEAIRKGMEVAKRNMITVPMVGTTIPHEVLLKLGAARIMLKPAAPGTGVISGGAMRAVIETAGIKDILTKSHGTNNPINTVRATLAALQSLRTAQQIAELRGKDVEQMVGKKLAAAYAPTATAPNAEADGGGKRRARAGRTSTESNPHEKSDRREARDPRDGRIARLPPHAADARAAGQPGRARHAEGGQVPGRGRRRALRAAEAQPLQDLALTLHQETPKRQLSDAAARPQAFAGRPPPGGPDRPWHRFRTRQDVRPRPEGTERAQRRLPPRLRGRPDAAVPAPPEAARFQEPLQEGLRGGQRLQAQPLHRRIEGRRRGAARSWPHPRGRGAQDFGRR